MLHQKKSRETSRIVTSVARGRETRQAKMKLDDVGENEMNERNRRQEWYTKKGGKTISK
jgi:hypothetical protein